MIFTTHYCGMCRKYKPCRRQRAYRGDQKAYYCESCWALQDDEVTAQQMQYECDEAVARIARMKVLLREMREGEGLGRPPKEAERPIRSGKRHNGKAML